MRCYDLCEGQFPDVSHGSIRRSLGTVKPRTKVPEEPAAERALCAGVLLSGGYHVHWGTIASVICHQLDARTVSAP